MTIDFDAITEESLRATGATKWATPGKIGAFVAEMDYGIAPVIRQALTDSLTLAQTGYLPPEMSTELQKSTTEWLESQFSWQVEPGRVRLLPDVLSGLGAMMEYFMPPQAPVIVTTPAYMPFVAIESIWHRPTIEVPLARDGERFVFDLDAIDAAFAQGGRLLVLCNPYNPVGRMLERAEMLAIAEVVERHGGRVFNDEIHAPLTFEGRQHIPYPTVCQEAARHSLTAMSASKAWNLPGLKCAELVISNDDDAARWEEVGLITEHGASNPGVLANAVAFREGRPWLEEVRTYLEGNRALAADLFARHLPEARVTIPEATYLSWVDFTAYDLPAEPAEFFDEHADVLLTAGLACGEVGGGCARLNLATTRPILTEIIERMGAAVARL